MDCVLLSFAGDGLLARPAHGKYAQHVDGIKAGQHGIICLVQGYSLLHKYMFV